MAACLNSLIQLKILRITSESTEEFKLMEDLTTMILPFIYLKTLIMTPLLKLIQHQQRKKQKVQHHKTQKTHIKKRLILLKLFLKPPLLKELSRLNQMLILPQPKINIIMLLKTKKMQLEFKEEFKLMEVLTTIKKMVSTIYYLKEHHSLNLKLQISQDLLLKNKLLKPQLLLLPNIVSKLPRLLMLPKEMLLMLKTLSMRREELDLEESL